MIGDVCVSPFVVNYDMRFTSIYDWHLAAGDSKRRTSVDDQSILAKGMTSDIT